MHVILILESVAVPVLLAHMDTPTELPEIEVMFTEIGLEAVLFAVQTG
jgi:hypothetical protein